MHHVSIKLLLMIDSNSIRDSGVDDPFRQPISAACTPQSATKSMAALIASEESSLDGVQFSSVVLIENSW